MRTAWNIMSMPQQCTGKYKSITSAGKKKSMSCYQIFNYFQFMVEIF